MARDIGEPEIQHNDSGTDFEIHVPFSGVVWVKPPTGKWHLAEHTLLYIYEGTDPNGQTVWSGAAWVRTWCKAAYHLSEVDLIHIDKGSVPDPGRPDRKCQKCYDQWRWHVLNS